VSRLALGPTQTSVQLVPGVLSPGVKRGRGVMLTTHPHLVPRSWMSRSYTSSPHCASTGVLWDCFTFTINMCLSLHITIQYVQWHRRTSCFRRVQLRCLSLDTTIQCVQWHRRKQLWFAVSRQEVHDSSLRANSIFHWNYSHTHSATVAGIALSADYWVCVCVCVCVCVWL
jgi:hypothetical protein